MRVNIMNLRANEDGQPMKIKNTLVKAFEPHCSGGDQKGHPSITSSSTSRTQKTPSMANMQPSGNMQPATENVQPSFASMQPAPTNMQPSLSNSKATILNIQPSITTLPPSTLDLHPFMTSLLPSIPSQPPLNPATPSQDCSWRRELFDIMHVIYHEQQTIRAHQVTMFNQQKHIMDQQQALLQRVDLMNSRFSLHVPSNVHNPVPSGVNIQGSAPSAPTSTPLGGSIQWSTPAVPGVNFKRSAPSTATSVPIVTASVPSGIDVQGSVPTVTASVPSGVDVQGSVPTVTASVPSGVDVQGSVPTVTASVPSGVDVQGSLPTVTASLPSGTDIQGSTPIDLTSHDGVTSIPIFRSRETKKQVSTDASLSDHTASTATNLSPPEATIPPIPTGILKTLIPEPEPEPVPQDLANDSFRTICENIHRKSYSHGYFASMMVKELYPSEERAGRNGSGTRGKRQLDIGR